MNGATRENSREDVQLGEMGELREMVSVGNNKGDEGNSYGNDKD